MQKHAYKFRLLYVQVATVCLAIKLRILKKAQPLHTWSQIAAHSIYVMYNYIHIFLNNMPVPIKYIVIISN